MEVRHIGQDSIFFDSISITKGLWLQRCICRRACCHEHSPTRPQLCSRPRDDRARRLAGVSNRQERLRLGGQSCWYHRCWPHWLPRSAASIALRLQGAPLLRLCSSARRYVNTLQLITRSDKYYYIAAAEAVKARRVEDLKEFVSQVRRIYLNRLSCN